MSHRLFRSALFTMTLLLCACGGGPPVIPPTNGAPASGPVSTTQGGAEAPLPVVLPGVDLTPPSNPVLAEADAFALRIATAANAFIQTHAVQDSTRNVFSAPWGNECVAVVQAILQAAQLPFVGPAGADGRPVVQVDAFRAALVADPQDWERLDPANPTEQAAPGDIWVQGDGYPGAASGQNHIGICQDWNCLHVVSNSSSHGSFTWSDTPAGYAEYYYNSGLPYLAGAIYHHR